MESLLPNISQLKNIVVFNGNVEEEKKKLDDDIEGMQERLSILRKL